MNKKLNTDGSVLLSALMIVTLFTVLGLTMLAISLNHTKQNEQQLQNLQAINTSEMGLKAYNHAIDHVTKDIQANHLSRSVDDLQSMLKDNIKESLSENFSSLSANPSFIVTRKILTDNDQKMVWEITSKGQAGNAEHTLVTKHTFTFTNSGGASKTAVSYKGVTPPYVDAALYTFNNYLFPFDDGFDGDIPNRFHSKSNKWGGITDNAKINGKIVRHGDPKKLDMAAIKQQFEINSNKYPLDKNNTSLLYSSYPNNLVVSSNFFHSVFIDDTASFGGNLLVIGNLIIDTKNKKDLVIPGYVYVTGNLMIFGNGNVTFKHTVYTEKNTYIAYIQRKVTFENGLVTNNAFGAALPKGTIVINSQGSAPATGNISSIEGSVNYK